MIRNAVIHILNEQPLLADLYGLPRSTDAGLICTNLRTMDGRRPVFIDDSAATFFFPYLHIRFVELPVGAMAGVTPAGADDVTNGTAHDDDPAAVALAARASAPAEEPPAGPEAADDGDLELDEDFLRRIREI